MDNGLGYINGSFVRFDELRLHVSDLGLQRGYGIFDYFREIDGKIYFLEDYLERFYTSAAGLALPVPLDRQQLTDLIYILVRENNYRDSGIKLLLTGGNSTDFQTPSVPNFIVLNVPGQPSYPGANENGVKLLLHEFLRYLPEVKTLYYLPLVRLLPQMKAEGATDVLFHFNGRISETSRSNIFLVKHGRIITPGTGVLKGITRKNLINILKGHIHVEERNVSFQELMTCHEAFITSTTRHIHPVIQIGTQVIGSGNVGEVTKKVMKLYEQLF
jgi:branched-chain amino acid aminotransferase